MPDKASSVVSGAVASPLSQTPIPAPSDHAGPGRIEETLAQHVAAASAMSLDIAGIRCLSRDILRQVAVQADPILAATIGMRVAHLLTGVSPAGGAAAERHGVRLPSDSLAKILGDTQAKAVLGDEPSVPVMAPAPTRHMEALWKEHVVDRLSGQAALNCSEDPAYGAPPPRLLEVAEAYLKTHPQETPHNFFQPFRDMVDRDFDIPDILPDAIEREWIPFDVLRDWVASAISRIDTARTTQDPLFDPGASVVHVMLLDEVESALCAAFSPLALGLLRNGQLSVARLAAWLGLDVDDGPDTSLAIRFGHTVMSKTLRNNVVTDAIPDPKVLRDPELLRELAGAGVPAEHIADLLSMARWVDWDVLKAEANWAIERYTAEDPARAYGWHLHSKWLGFGKLTPADFHARMNALHELSRTRLDALRVETTPALESYRRLTRLGPLADVWMVAAPSDAGASPASPLRWKLLPFTERVDAWRSAGMSIDQQYWAGRLFVHGLDESRACRVVRANSDYPDRLQAWRDCGPEMDLRPWLDGGMQHAVEGWLTDRAVSAGALALLPGMIRCELEVDQIDALIRSPVPITRLSAIFGPQAQTPMCIGAGLLTASALCDRVNHGGMGAEELQAAWQKAAALSPLRRAACLAREQLRTRRHAMEAIRAAISPETPAARQCDAWIRAWCAAEDTLRALLQSPLEDRLRDDPRGVEETLFSVFSNLAFSPVGSAEPIDRAALRA